MFFALNLKICRILRFTIWSYDLRSHLPSTILRRIPILTTLVMGIKENTFLVPIFWANFYFSCYFFREPKLEIENYYCHDPNQILEFVTMTDMLISSLSLIVGARGLRKDKTTKTIACSSGESTLSLRSGVTRGEEGKRQNTS